MWGSVTRSIHFLNSCLIFPSIWVKCTPIDLGDQPVAKLHLYSLFQIECCHSNWVLYSSCHFRDRLLKDTEPKWNNWRAQHTGQYRTQDKSMGMPHSREKICWKNCTNCKTQNLVSNFRAPFMSSSEKPLFKVMRAVLFFRHFTGNCLQPVVRFLTLGCFCP